MQRLNKVALWLEDKLYAALSAQMPVVHTAWQAAAGVLVAGLFTVKSTQDAKLLVAAVVATFLAALKAAYLKART